MKTLIIEKKERTFLRKILGLKKVPGEEYTFHLRSNKELYEKFEEVSASMRKRRLFYGHIRRLGTEKLANKILTLQERWKSQPPWLQEVHQDLERTNITMDNIWNRTSYRKKIERMKEPVQEKRTMTAEERIIRSQRMKNLWQTAKQRGRNTLKKTD